MRTRRKVILAIIAIFAAGCTLAACTPRHDAVGDTQHVEQTPAHDSLQGATISVGFIGSSEDSADELILNTYKRDDIDAIYLPTKDAADSMATIQTGVQDYVHRKVKAIMIGSIDVNESNVQQWNNTLNIARNAGIPVILLNPVNPPSDTKLYATSFIINDRMMDATPLAQATETIVRDEPHEKEIFISTNEPTQSTHRVD